MHPPWAACAISVMLHIVQGVSVFLEQVLGLTKRAFPSSPFSSNINYFLNTCEEVSSAPSTQTHRDFEEHKHYEPLSITRHYYFFSNVFSKRKKKRKNIHTCKCWERMERMNSNERSSWQSSPPPLQSECCDTSKCQHKCQLQNYKQQWVFEEDVWQSQKGQRPACLIPFSSDYIFLDHCTMAISYLWDNLSS